MKLFRATLFSLFLLIACFGKNDSTSSVAKKFFINKIVLQGNEITEADIIFSEMTFKEGDWIDSTILFFNRERIYSLGLFTSVEMIVGKELEDTLIIAVEESWYIWPIPFISFTESDGLRTTYGMNVSILNFRGRNEQIDFILALGFDPFYKIRYQVPYLFREEKISLDMMSEYTTIKNRSRKAELIHGGDFEQKFFIGSISFGKRFNIYNTASITLEYQNVQTPFFNSLIAISDDEKDVTLNGGLAYTYDSRDLVQFPANGFYFRYAIKNYGFGMNDISYRVAEIDSRFYDTLFNDFSYKLKFGFRTVGGDKIPNYAHSFFGYEEKIRGYYNQQDEGHTRLFSSFEIKYPIISEMNWSIDLPLVPSSLTSYRLAIYSEIFLDAGTSKFREDKWNSSVVNAGFGFGFTVLLLPYSVGRFEVGFDKKFNSEIILTYGTSF